MSATATSYERVPYPRHAYGFTHPDRLATLAMLAGMMPPPIETCRVLELGCASGSNLVPMACALPRAEFVGLDLSTTQIAAADRFANDLGLANIRFQACDLRSLDRSSGEFDYIIAHGLHSWVPSDAQEAILRICGQLLSPHGVAIVSYNAYPGCHLRQMVRGIGRFHTRDIDDPHEKVGQLHAAVCFLADSLGEEYSVYRQVLRSESQRLSQLNDAFVLHDTLEDVNLPVYFHEFIAQANRHGLQYLDEAIPLDRRRIGLSAEQRAELRQKFDPIEYEQHLDFLEGLAFRRTIVCRDAHVLNRDPDAASLSGLLIASQAAPTSGSSDAYQKIVSVENDEPLEFSTRRGPSVTAIRCDRAIAKAAMLTLAAVYPKSLSFEELSAAAAAGLNRPPAPTDAADLRDLALAGHHLNVVDLHGWQPTMALAVSPQPEASALARYQAAQDWEITTLWHERLTLGDPLSRQLVQLLDGRRTLGQLLDDSVEFVMNLADKTLPGAVAPRTRSDLESELAPQIKGALETFARAGILVA